METSKSQGPTSYVPSPRSSNQVDPGPRTQDLGRKYWLGLCWFEQFGSRTLWRLWKKLNMNGQRAWNANFALLRQIGVRQKAAEDFIEWRKKIDLSAFSRRCKAEGIDFILPDDDQYPQILKEIPDPPLCIFSRGTTIQPSNLSIGVVGTRACTPYGLRVTRDIVGELAAQGIPIISGLALGIDGAAHRAALESKGRTIAVLGSGVNSEAIYPRQHANLAKEILDNNGTIISEFPPGTEGLPFHFPLRNRIIASLSHAILVVEAAQKSGSLITAKLALDYNREVFAIPGPITNKASSGTNELIKTGAIPCTDAKDILDHFELKCARDPPKPINLTEMEQAVLNLLTHPLHADDIVRALKITSSEMAPILTNLELHGIIMQEEPNTYSRTRRN